MCCCIWRRWRPGDSKTNEEGATGQEVETPLPPPLPPSAPKVETPLARQVLALPKAAPAAASPPGAKPDGQVLPKQPETNLALWAEALSVLSEADRVIVLSLTTDPDSSSIDRKRLADDIGEKIQAAFKELEHDNRFRRIIDKTLSVLQKFASAVDVAVSFDPAHAALPWAAVRAVLGVSPLAE